MTPKNKCLSRDAADVRAAEREPDADDVRVAEQRLRPSWMWFRQWSRMTLVKMPTGMF